MRRFRSAAKKKTLERIRHTLKTGQTRCGTEGGARRVAASRGISRILRLSLCGSAVPAVAVIRSLRRWEWVMVDIEADRRCSCSGIQGRWAKPAVDAGAVVRVLTFNIAGAQPRDRPGLGSTTCAASGDSISASSARRCAAYPFGGSRPEFAATHPKGRARLPSTPGPGGATPQAPAVCAGAVAVQPALHGGAPLRLHAGVGCDSVPERPPAHANGTRNGRARRCSGAHGRASRSHRGDIVADCGWCGTRRSWLPANDIVDRPGRGQLAYVPLITGARAPSSDRYLGRHDPGRVRAIVTFAAGR